MVTEIKKKKKKSLKTSVKLYRKKNDSGSYSLFLNIWHNGERLPKEFLGIVLTGKLSGEENRDKLRIAEKARNKREGELLHQRNAIPLIEADQDANVYEFIRLKSKHLKRPQRYEYVIMKLHRYSGKGILPLSAITKKFCMGFQEFLRGHLGQGTAYQTFACFSSFLNRAYEEEIIKENPIRRIARSERIKKKKSVPEYLSLEDIELLTENSEGIHPQVRLAFLFSCFTGLRFVDLCQMRYSHFMRYMLEGRMVSMLHFTQVKTEDAGHIPLNEQAEEILAERKRMAKTEPESPFLFPVLSEQGQWDNNKYNYARYELSRWKKKSKLDKRLHFHLGRHTFATLAITYGADIYTTSKLLGHADIRSTQIYAHVLSRPKIQAMDNLSQAMNQFRDNKRKEGAA